MSRRRMLAWGLAALLGCGSSGKQGGGTGGAAGAAGHGPGGGSAGAGGGTAGGGLSGGGPDAAVDAPVGPPPTQADLQGCWYASVAPPKDGGVSTVKHKRLRFDGTRYFLVSNGLGLYCAETGTFQIQDGSVEFNVDDVQGYGPCVEGPARTETVRWSGSGITFEFQGTPADYAKIRGVPKLFVTVETHDGAFATDASLAGTNAIAKADAFCDQSIAKPDSGHYRAVFWDGVNRQGPGGTDWILQSQTTYFQADGVRNVFTTDARGIAAANQPVIVDSATPAVGAWSGNGCAGWTSASSSVTGSSTGGMTFGLAGSSDACDALKDGVLCVGDGQPINAGLGGAVDGGAGDSSDLQGGWQAVADSGDGGVAVASNQRLRFDGNRYVLVSNAGGTYCGEEGTFQRSAGGIQFGPERERGWGPCQIGDIRSAALAVTASDITLTSQGASQRFSRIAAVPKMFLTLELHNGDFADDSTLPGAGAISRADSFCAASAARPDGQMYKAVLVDGTSRAASPPIDWVLDPGTTYYQAAGVLPLMTTNSQGLYDTSKGFVNGYLTGFTNIQYMWTGLDFDLTSATSNCQSWSSLASSVSGTLGNVGGQFATNVSTACLASEALICVSP